MAAVGVESLYASFLISKRKRVSLLESNEDTFPEASIGYLLASQACAYSSTNLSLDSEVGNTVLFFPPSLIFVGWETQPAPKRK